jgi:hypothetical protein
VGIDGFSKGTCIGEFGDPIVVRGTVVDGVTTGYEVRLGTDGTIIGIGIVTGARTCKNGASRVGEALIVGLGTPVDGSIDGVEIGTFSFPPNKKDQKTTNIRQIVAKMDIVVFPCLP